MSQTAPGRCDRNGVSLIDLFTMFPDDAAAEAWFIRSRWPAGICCHYCGSERVLVGAKHKTMPYRCREKGCRKRFSVRTGTVLQSSKLGFQVWAIGIYLVATNLKGISSMKLHRELHVTQRTAWHLAHRIRETLTSQTIQFEGPVEADETFVGGKAKNMHRSQRQQLTGRGGADKMAIAGIKDRQTKRVRATVVERVDAPTLQGFVTDNTAPGATIYTDDATAYAGLAGRESVKHSVGEYVRGMAHTNGIESFWSMLKRGYVGTFHKMSPDHLHRYVGEFEGRHNARPLDTIEQMAQMVTSAEGKRLKYADLIDHGSGEAVALREDDTIRL